MLCEFLYYSLFSKRWNMTPFIWILNLPIESLHDAVRTYTHTILSRSLVSFLYGAVCRKSRKSAYFDLLYSKIWNFNRVCVLIFLSLGRNLVLWYELDKKIIETFCCIFLYPAMPRGNNMVATSMMTCKTGLIWRNAKTLYLTSHPGSSWLWYYTVFTRISLP